MKKLLTPSLLLLLTACASTAPTLPDGLATLTNPNTLSCRFTKQSDADPKTPATNWYFWRQAQRTETRDERSNQGEIWQKIKGEQFFYTRLFYNEQVALDFMPSDLAAIGNKVSWPQLTSLVDPDSLGKALALQNKATVNGMAVESYSGTINGVGTEVDWLPALKLPARLVKKQAQGTLSLTLADCSPTPQQAVKPISETELNAMRHLDYTDLGDMETDPMAQHLEQLMGDHHHDHH
jgi:hypothetical protein